MKIPGLITSLADIRIIKGLRSDIGAAAIHAMSQIVFPPAVKNGAFATEPGKVEYEFSIH